MTDKTRKAFDLFEDDEQIMRLGLGMTLFFPRPFEAARTGVWELWQRYVAFVGKDKFTWARLGGGNRSRAVSTPVFRTIESWLTGQKDYGNTCWVSIHDGPMDCLGQN